MAANTTSAARAFALLLSLLLLLYRPPIATAQTSSSSGCFTTINSLALRETGVDTTERRTHALCANNIFTIGALDFDNQVYDGQEPIPLRSNLHLKCGFDGLKENNCVVTGGDVQVDGTHFLGVRDSDRLDNVTLEGITFVNAGKYMAWLTKPGTVKFVNCEFRENRFATSAVLADYFDPSDSSEELKVSFEGCVFDDNIYGGSPRQPALVVSNSQQNRLVLQRNVFSNNDMVKNNTIWHLNSYLIESSGPLTMNENCFENNQVGVSPVVVYTPESLLSDNYGNESDGGTCHFASRYETSAKYEARAPSCTSYDANTCTARETSTPSLTPTAKSTPKPTKKPTTKISTNSPSESPILQPLTLTSQPSARTGTTTVSQSQDKNSGAAAARSILLQQSFWIGGASILLGCMVAW